MAINPIQDPTNYMGQVPQVDLAGSLTSGLQLGTIYREAQDKQIEQQRLQQVRQKFSEDLQAAQADGSQKAWVGMAVNYPQFREVFGDARKAAGEERLNKEFTQAFEISNALESGKPDVAMSRLQLIIDARKNSGEPTNIYDDVLTALQNGDIKGAQSGVNLALTVADPDRFEKSVKARTTAATASSVVTEAIAKSEQAVSDAQIKLAMATNAEEVEAAKTALAVAQARKAQVDAQYAEKTVLADLKKKAADLGLTQAQTGSALAQTKKLGVETQKAALDLEALKATGGIDPEKKFAQEEKIRKEYQGRTKVFGELQGTFNTLQASSESANGPGDIALITGFMKMLDPGSVVRETEFATARDTAGLFTQLQNRLEKAQNGQLLSPAQRKEYVSLAQKYLDSAQKKADEDKKALGVVVKNYRLNPENVFGPATTNVTVDY
jgi:hypothetical protein